MSVNRPFPSQKIEEEKSKKLKPRTTIRKENLAHSETNLESASMTSFSTTHSKMNMNSASCNSLRNNNDAHAATVGSAGNLAEGKKMAKQRTRAMARESGYSSCGDESAGEHVSKLNSCENLDEEELDEQHQQQQYQPKVCSMKSAIKSNVVDKILIDSSDFIKPKPTNLNLLKPFKGRG